MVTQMVTSRDGTRIAFETVGMGPAVLLVNGALAYRECFSDRPLAAELGSEFTVITYDRRGRGESTDTRPYAVEREIEDIEALIDEAGGSAYLYGFSSGAVLALQAAAKLGAAQVDRLVVHQPPFGSDDDQTRQDYDQYKRRVTELLAADQRREAVTFFFSDMLPPDMLEGMRQWPEWPLMVGVAHTLAYDNAVLGDGAIPVRDAKAATMTTLVLDSSASVGADYELSDALVRAMPHARRKTLDVQPGMVPPHILAPVLTTFFKT